MSHLSTCSYDMQQRSLFDYLRGESEELDHCGLPLYDSDKQEHFYTMLISSDSSAWKLINMVVSTDGLEDVSTQQ